jgi:uncharacterized protein
VGRYCERYAQGTQRRWKALISSACVALFVGLGVLRAAPSTGAENGDDLYQARTIVTGRGEENRLRGFPLCFADVLIKVSGDPRLIDDPRLGPLQAQAPTFVVSFDYHDRMAGLATHDEQGTRDRPYDLIVHFDRDKIDAALKSLGRVPWTTPRPRVVVLFGMKQATAKYVLTRDGDRVGPKESLAAAAEKRGIPILIPSTRELAMHRVAWEDLTGDMVGFDAIRRGLGADVALAGQLIWQEEELGWAASWSLVAADGVHRWQVRGVTFDAAFRNALGGSAQILSGHGDPK